MSKHGRRHVWVLAASVFSKSKVRRRMSQLELLAAWDYAGKIWYRQMTSDDIGRVLGARLQSPPGKITNSVVFSLCQELLQETLPLYSNGIEVQPQSGRKTSTNGTDQLWQDAWNTNSPLLPMMQRLTLPFGL